MENKKIKTILFFLPLLFVLIFSATPIRADNSIPALDEFGEPVNTSMPALDEFNTPTPVLNIATSNATSTTSKDAGLELVYPQIPGAVTPQYISTGIPAYVEYLFNLAVWAIGLIIFFVLLYQGFLYFTSAGNPGKLTDSIDGIKSAGLGAIILLSAYLIFNTINPQLTILNAPDLTILAPNVMPGIYICNYRVTENLESIIENYMNTDDESDDQEQAGIGGQIRIDAAEKIGALIVPKDKNKLCYRVYASGDLTNFYFNGKENTIFSIPRKEYVIDTANPGKTKVLWAYDYGIIFHENNLRKGACAIVDVYGAWSIGNIQRITSSRSITLFTKPSDEPPNHSQGSILYECINYNDITKCPSGVTTPAMGVFPKTSMQAGDYYQEFGTNDLSSSTSTTSLAGNTRSIKFDPEGSYFAVLNSGGDSFSGDTCEVLSSNDPDLSNNPIGQCPTGASTQVFQGSGWGAGPVNVKTLGSCLQSMVVIKGRIL